MYKQAASVREERLKIYAIILAIRDPFTKIIKFGDYITTPALMSHFMNFAGLPSDDIERNHDLLSMRNEDLVEETLKDILDEALKIAKEVKIPQTGDDAVLFILNTWGDRVLNTILNSIYDLGCLKKFYYIVGSSSFELSSLFKFKNLYNSFAEWSTQKGALETSRSCIELDRLLLVDEHIPVLNALLLLYSSVEGFKNEIRIRDGKINTCHLVREAID